MKVISVFLGCLLPVLLQAQVSNYSWKETHVKSELYLQFLSELGRTVDFEYNVGNAKENISFNYLTSLGFEYNTRIVFYNYSDFFSLSFSPNFSLQFNGLYSVNRTSFVDESDGSAIVPALSTYLDANLGNGANFNSIEKLGLSVGVGLNYGLFFNNFKNIKTQGFVSPRFRLGYKQTLNFSNYSSIGVYFTYGINRASYAQNVFDLRFGKNGFIGLSINYSTGYKLRDIFF